MRTNYVLIDFENIQPTDLVLLKDGPFKVHIFLGSNQTKIPVEMAIALQSLGSSVRYLQIVGSGSNALDFHIAFTIGQLARDEPDAWFHIISKDKGFDPLIGYLSRQKLHATRQVAIKDIPLLLTKAPPELGFDEKLHAIVANLKAKKAAKPARQKTLASTIQSIFANSLSDEDVCALIAGLVSKGWIALIDQKVSYDLPA